MRYLTTMIRRIFDVDSTAVRRLIKGQGHSDVTSLAADTQSR